MSRLAGSGRGAGCSACAAASPAELAGDVDDLFHGRRPTRLMSDAGPHAPIPRVNTSPSAWPTSRRAHGRMRDAGRAGPRSGSGNRPSRAERMNEGDSRPKHEIVGVPHLAHAALADARDHPVAPGKHQPAAKREVAPRSARWRCCLSCFPVAQRLHFLPQPRVGPAGLGHKRVPFGRGHVERLQKDILRAQRQRRHFDDSK